MAEVLEEFLTEALPDPDGTLAPAAPAIYDLKDVGRAHQDMEARKTHGAVVLKVS